MSSFEMEILGFRYTFSGIGNYHVIRDSSLRISNWSLLAFNVCGPSTVSFICNESLVIIEKLFRHLTPPPLLPPFSVRVGAAGLAYASASYVDQFFWSNVYVPWLTGFVMKTFVIGHVSSHPSFSGYTTIGRIPRGTQHLFVVVSVRAFGLFASGKTLCG